MRWGYDNEDDITIETDDQIHQPLRLEAESEEQTRKIITTAVFTAPTLAKCKCG
jgi:hypothetical protein